MTLKCFDVEIPIPDEFLSEIATSNRLLHIRLHLELSLAPDVTYVSSDAGQRSSVTGDVDQTSTIRKTILRHSSMKTICRYQHSGCCQTKQETHQPSSCPIIQRQLTARRNSRGICDQSGSDSLI